ncbi:MAG: hypothetical protein DME22_16425, partial [Verrucomicrobia bacterium]
MRLLAPKATTRFVRYRGRLALFHNVARHEDYWRDYWTDAKRNALLNNGSQGEFGEFESVFSKHLPKAGRILEAGCGAGHLVAALKARGYSAFGVDYELEVVDFLNREYPDLAIHAGNILKLDLPAKSLNGYVSLGVVEHFEEGPDPALREARRVLQDGGVALISVPHLNPLRQRYLGRLQDSSISQGLFFHQFYYGPKEFSSLLMKEGFRVVELFPYAVEAFLTREHPLVARFWRSSFSRERLRCFGRAWIASFRGALAMRYSHMLMYVC